MIRRVIHFIEGITVKYITNNVPSIKTKNLATTLKNYY